jgi:hypothetical protein
VRQSEVSVIVYSLLARSKCTPLSHEKAASWETPWTRNGIIGKATSVSCSLECLSETSWAGYLVHLLYRQSSSAS